MTELIRAEDWQKKILERLTDWENDNAGSSLDAEVDILRDVQRNAAQHYLEAAAKAVCFGCQKEWPMAEREWTEYHVKDGRRLHCNALAIKALIAEDPAPAGNETQEDDR